MTRVKVSPLGSAANPHRKNPHDYESWVGKFGGSPLSGGSSPLKNKELLGSGPRMSQLFAHCAESDPRPLRGETFRSCRFEGSPSEVRFCRGQGRTVCSPPHSRTSSKNYRGKNPRIEKFEGFRLSAGSFAPRGYASARVEALEVYMFVVVCFCWYIYFSSFRL